MKKEERKKKELSFSLHQIIHKALGLLIIECLVHPQPLSTRTAGAVEGVRGDFHVQLGSNETRDCMHACMCTFIN